jgi:hypothetical protein
MTDIEAKALALVREVLTERDLSDKRAVRREVSPYTEALCRALEQHEAFKQEVGFALSNEWHNLHYGAKRNLDRFRIPLPKPDPLEEVLKEIDHSAMWVDQCAEEIRAALGERGWEIREKGQ